MIPKIYRTTKYWAVMGYKYQVIYREQGKHAVSIMVHNLKEALQRWWWIVTGQY